MPRRTLCSPVQPVNVMSMRQNTFFAKLLAAFLVLTVTACNGCRTTTNPDGSVQWPAILECSPSASDLVGPVSEVLYAGKGVRETLTSFAQLHGPDVVICVVEHLRRQWSASNASMTNERREAMRNANDFLNYVETDVQWKGGDASSARGSGPRRQRYASALL